MYSTGGAGVGARGGPKGGLILLERNGMRMRNGLEGNVFCHGIGVGARNGYLGQWFRLGCAGVGARHGRGG